MIDVFRAAWDLCRDRQRLLNFGRALDRVAEIGVHVRHFLHRKRKVVRMVQGVGPHLDDANSGLLERLLHVSFNADFLVRDFLVKINGVDPVCAAQREQRFLGNAVPNSKPRAARFQLLAQRRHRLDQELCAIAARLFKPERGLAKLPLVKHIRRNDTRRMFRRSGQRGMIMEAKIGAEPHQGRSAAPSVGGRLYRGAEPDRGVAKLREQRGACRLCVLRNDWKRKRQSSRSERNKRVGGRGDSAPRRGRKGAGGAARCNSGRQLRGRSAGDKRRGNRKRTSASRHF
mmetsp:Transcript_6248/g.16675  ORF Transcript_6248/g.16675 Transcript_6248/m.16675 type:complete len:287 (-) Transcript_6248:131-991(-)